jgi:hypothetical protein
MQIKVQTKDDAGNVTFDGTLNKAEAELILNVGINFLLANGIQPMFSGQDDEGTPETIVAKTPDTVQ